MDEITIGISGGAAGGGVLGTLITLGVVYIRSRKNGAPAIPAPAPAPMGCPGGGDPAAVARIEGNTEVLKAGQTAFAQVLQKVNDQGVAQREVNKQLTKSMDRQSTILQKLEKKL